MMKGKSRNIVRRVWVAVKKEFVWLTSRRVLDAINGGATYEEVCAIVAQEVGA